MTPAEFRRIADAKIQQRTEEWKFLDILNGVRCALMANINRSQSSRTYKPDDFRVMPDEKKQTPEQIMETFEVLAKGGQNG